MILLDKIAIALYSPKHLVLLLCHIHASRFQTSFRQLPSGNLNL
jgi:hypothetical protein